MNYNSNKDRHCIYTQKTLTVFPFASCRQQWKVKASKFKRTKHVAVEIYEKEYDLFHYWKTLVWIQQ